MWLIPFNQTVDSHKALSPTKQLTLTLWQMVEQRPTLQHDLCMFELLAAAASSFFLCLLGLKELPASEPTCLFSFPLCGMLQHLNFKDKCIDFFLSFCLFLTREFKKKLLSFKSIEIVLERLDEPHKIFIYSCLRVKAYALQLHR